MIWTGKREFLLAQAQVCVILAIAYIGNTWPHSYPRNDNHNPHMFWIMNICLGIAALFTFQHDVNGSARGVQLLSRNQTEEWKGWMQFAFIMYHYYRAYFVYNEIRVFVSAYVWMTGFGNFLYFDKKQDFSMDRMISMWIRINYFPILLSVFLSVPLELYYVVPLHTAGFFITMATCYISYKLQEHTKLSAWNSNGLAIAIALAVHVVFYETPCVNFLKLFSDEYYFRFQADKYSAWVGMLSGLLWCQLKRYMQWVYAGESATRLGCMWLQRICGILLLFVWYNAFGWMTDKYTYNPLHPYVFWMPVAGFLMLRNSSKYLTEVHSTALEFFGKITLETYVLQFHLFMCNNVQHIPIVIPNSGPDGPLWIKTANMLLCGVIFVSTAVWARKVTISTQTTVVELVDEVRKQMMKGIPRDGGDSDTELFDKEKQSFMEGEEESLTNRNDNDNETELVSVEQRQENV
jgi:hypothetical protein